MALQVHMLRAAEGQQKDVHVRSQFVSFIHQSNTKLYSLLESCVNNTDGYHKDRTNYFSPVELEEELWVLEK